jgi:hypothetical protein
LLEELSGSDDPLDGRSSGWVQPVEHGVVQLGPVGQRSQHELILDAGCRSLFVGGGEVDHRRVC